MSSHDPGGFGAAAGEAGFETLLAARTWRVAARHRGEHEPHDVAALRAALLGLFDCAGVPEPPPRPRRLTLWGLAVDPADLLVVLVAPRRPPIPGITIVDRLVPGL